MKFIKGIVLNVFRFLGYNLSKEIIVDDERSVNRHDVRIQNDRIPNLETITIIGAQIQGMISIDSARFLYTLCYLQDEKGDVLEIGSWLGRSTVFLANAVKDSRNGSLYAVDHFKGNRGKEHFYKVGEDDLSDIKTLFLDNLNSCQVRDYVNVLDMPNHDALLHISDNSFRFLFIDGDHSKKGVEKDIELFFPLLVEGALVIFDDYSGDFPELVSVVDNLIEKGDFSRVMYYRNTIVLKTTSSLISV